MPVQAGVFHQDVAPLRDKALAHAPPDPEKNHAADDHMQGVEPGHEVIQVEKGHPARRERQVGGTARINAVVDLGAPLHILDDQEDQGKTESDQKTVPGKGYPAALDSAHGQGHGHAAGDEHHGVDRAQNPVELQPAGMEFGRIPAVVHGKEQEQPAKQQQLGEEKKPHAHAGANVVLRTVVNGGFRVHD